MKNIFLLILSIFIFASARAEDQNFPYSVVGLKWSRNLGHSSNGCFSPTSSPFPDYSQCGDDGNHQVQVKDEGNKLGSRAAQRCLEIGGRLPTHQEYLNLVIAFDHEKGRFQYHPDVESLTAKGFADLTSAFGEEDIREAFWSSSLTESPEEAWVFDATPMLFVGVVASADSSSKRHYSFAVRCVGLN